jgi:hypothetical protein
MGFRTSVSFRPAIQATGLLALAPAGLTPAEHISVTLDTRELLKLGIDVAERSVSRLMLKRRPQPSQTWRTFLANRWPGRACSSRSRLPSRVGGEPDPSKLLWKIEKQNYNVC